MAELKETNQNINLSTVRTSLPSDGLQVDIQTKSQNSGLESASMRIRSTQDMSFLYFIPTERANIFSKIVTLLSNFLKFFEQLLVNKLSGNNAPVETINAPILKKKKSTITGEEEEELEVRASGQ